MHGISCSDSPKFDCVAELQEKIFQISDRQNLFLNQDKMVIYVFKQVQLRSYQQVPLVLQDHLTDLAANLKTSKFGIEHQIFQKRNKKELEFSFRLKINHRILAAANYTFTFLPFCPLLKVDHLSWQNNLNLHRYYVEQQIFGFLTSGLALTLFAPFLVRSIVCFGPTFVCCAPTTTGDPELKTCGVDLVLVMTEVCFAIDIEFWVGLDLPP